MCVSMYLRSTKRKNKDGSSVEYYQLAHNERHPITRKPVAKIIHNFGRPISSTTNSSCGCASPSPASAA